MVGARFFSLKVIGNGSGVAEAIAERLTKGHDFTETEQGPFDLVMIDAVDEEGDTPFLELSDEDFERLYLAPTVRLERVTAMARTLIKPSGSLLLVGTDAYLGKPEGAPQSAAAGSMVILGRSLGRMDPPVRCNIILLPIECDRRHPDMFGDAARLALAVTGSETLCGLRLFLDGAAHLASRHVEYG